ncbi:MAG: MATE family efflux transporter [Calditrichaeota bacterium]|nr:MAG: MATE family efflux transporter [Calditrichota bacterium]
MILKNTFLKNIKIELRPMAKLALPVVIAEVSWVMMGMVDTLMVGRIGALAIGAVSIGSSIVIFMGLLGMGVLFGLDYLVSKMYGAGKLDDCHHSLIQGVYISLIFGVLLTGMTYSIIFLLPYSTISPAIVTRAIGYMQPTSFSILPLLLFTTARRYLQARSVVKPITVLMFIANGVNAIANWMLIFGKLGAPQMGATGAGYATLISMSFMAAGLVVYILYMERMEHSGLFHASLAFDWTRIREIITIGLPVAIHMAFEVGAFTLATILAGLLDANSLAAHHIVLKVASFTFMVPLGVSNAGAVRIGQAIGREYPQGAIRSGRTALIFSASFMSLSGLAFILLPYGIMRSFTIDDTVIQIGISLLAVAAFFQLFDGIQVTGAGTLRGLGDTRKAMIFNLVGHWILGIPVGYLLCFYFDGGIWGLWIGLCIGLVFVSFGMLYYWLRYEKKLALGIVQRDQLLL